MVIRAINVNLGIAFQHFFDLEYTAVNKLYLIMIYGSTNIFTQSTEINLEVFVVLKCVSRKLFHD